ncbi:MAG TPA: 3'-5' exonuclease, partial [Geobacteraceae bacterium]|nr:3'-5' exonuclease [Geobacteraceae bacterium]
LAELADQIIKETGYEDRLREDRSEEAQDRLNNLQELLTALEEFEQKSNDKTLSGFLEQAALVSDNETEEGPKSAVTLMTLHSAKGLEFPVVFMIGMEERLFPHVRSLEDREQMEEERRLCYVGMTRAKERLFLTNARRRRTFGQEQYNTPSRFIGDIPKDLLEMEEEYQAGFGFGYDAEYEPAGAEGAVSYPTTTGEKTYGHNLASVLTAESAPQQVREVEIVPDEPAEVFVGMKVRHGKFGLGTIRYIEGRGDQQKAVVWFNSVGQKKLLLRFAGLERA